MYPNKTATSGNGYQRLTTTVNFDDKIGTPNLIIEQVPARSAVNQSKLNGSVSVNSGGSATPSPSRSPVKVGRTQFTLDRANPYHDGKDLYFPIEDVDVQSFHNDLPLSPRKHTFFTLHGNYSNNKDNTSTIHGKKIQVNGKELALFCYRDQFYAVDEKCPHLGGPLHLGDIEDLPGSDSPHVICPWHKWKFNLSTGRRVRPSGGYGVQQQQQKRSIESYPVRTDDSGKISIGFKSIDSSCFGMEDF